MQVEQERAKLTGRAGSLAPKIAAYESLALQREVAEKALLQASAALLTAEQDVRRQKLYLDRIVEPNLADRPMEPRRLRAILIVFLSSMALYLLGRLLWAGLREHRQE
ncbi:polysaccharide export inner-membrane protein, BexC/CtrB/KpsE family [compost metagenome]